MSARELKITRLVKEFGVTFFLEKGDHSSGIPDVCFFSDVIYYVKFNTYEH